MTPHLRLFNTHTHPTPVLCPISIREHAQCMGDCFFNEYHWNPMQDYKRQAKSEEARANINAQCEERRKVVEDDFDVAFGIMNLDQFIVSHRHFSFIESFLRNDAAQNVSAATPEIVLQSLKSVFFPDVWLDCQPRAFEEEANLDDVGTFVRCLDEILTDASTNVGLKYRDEFAMAARLVGLAGSWSNTQKPQLRFDFTRAAQSPLHKLQSA